MSLPLISFLFYYILGRYFCNGTYFQIIQELERSHDNKKVKDAEYSLGRLGLKLGVAITLNPTPMPPLESELKYAEEHGMKIEKCDDGHYRWFK